MRPLLFFEDKIEKLAFLSIYTRSLIAFQVNFPLQQAWFGRWFSILFWLHFLSCAYWFNQLRILNSMWFNKSLSLWNVCVGNLWFDALTKKKKDQRLSLYRFNIFTKTGSLILQANLRKVSYRCAGRSSMSSRSLVEVLNGPRFRRPFYPQSHLAVVVRHISTSL